MADGMMPEGQSRVYRGSRSELIQQLRENNPGMTAATAAKIVDDHLEAGFDEIVEYQVGMMTMAEGTTEEELTTMHNLVIATEEALGTKIYKD